MPLNLSSPQYRVWIAQPGQDATTGLEVTGLCSGASGGFLTVTVEPFDESGLIAVTGRLVLDVPTLATTVEGRIHQYADPLYDPWVTPAQWRAGNRVLIQIADSFGTLRRLPFALLYLIGEPMPPYPGNWQLNLELGNRFKLLDSVRPKRIYNPMGGSAVVGGNPEGPISGSRQSVISDMLASLDLEFNSGLPGPGLRDYQRDWNSPVVGQVGELAMGGFAALWLDPDDRVRPVWLGTLPDRRLFKHVVGVDDAADYEPLQSPLRPATDVEVISPESAVELVENPNEPPDQQSSQSADYDERENSDQDKYAGSSTTEEFGTIGSVDGTDNATEIRVAVRNEIWGWSGPRYQSSVKETRCRGLVIPQDLYDLLEQQGRSIVAPPPLTPINSLLVEETRIYEGGDEGRLLSIRRTITRPKGEVLAEWYKRNLLPNTSLPEFGDPMIAETQLTRFRYQTTGGKDSKGQVREIRTTIWRTRGQLAAAANDWTVAGIAGPITQVGSTDPTVAETKLERWRRRSAGEWEYQIQHRRAGEARNGTIKGFLTLRTIQHEVKSSRNGDIQPPAADRRPGDPDQERNRRISYLRRGRIGTGADDDAPRERQVIVSHMASARDCITLAELLLKLDQIRHRGYRITGKWRDEWWSWQPLARVDLQLGSTVYWGVVNALTLAMAANQVVVIADCMRSGRHPDGDSYPYPPLPPLSPADPDPGPLPTSPLPDQTNQQPVIPTISARWPFEVAAIAGADWQVFGWELGVFEGGVLGVSAEAGADILDFFEVGAIGGVQIEQIPLLEVGAIGGALFEELGAELPFGEWPLDAIPWLDEAGSRNLSASGDAPILGSDIDGGYTEFNWTDELEISYLGDLRSGPTQWTRTATGNFHWRLRFDIWWPATGAVDFSVLVENEFEIGLTETSVYLNLRNSVFDSFGSIGAVQQSFGTAPDRSSWHTVEGEFNATTNQLYIRFNGITYGPAGLTDPEFNPITAVDDSPLIVGLGSPANVRVKNIKFFRSNPVER